MPTTLPMPVLRRLLLCGLLAIACVTAAGCRSRGEPKPDLPPVDLQRFMGTWHVIAHVPYFAERGHVESSDTYTLQDDGEISVLYRYREGFDQPREELRSRAKVKEDTGNREWTTYFFRYVPTKYRIVEVDDGYQWAIIDYPGRDLAWIFSRAPDMDADTYRDLERRARDHGINTDKLRRIPRHPDQVGRLGYGDAKSP